MPFSAITSIALFTLLAIFQAAPAKQGKPASTPKGKMAPIKLSAGVGKQLRVVSGTNRAIINLTEDIAGCLTLFDPSMSSKRIKQPLGVKLLDQVSKNEKYYLIVLASAQSNCNVQSHCGAASDYTLIWLELDANLHLTRKQAEAIELCRSDIYVLDPQSNDQDAPPLKLTKGKLVIEYGSSDSGQARTNSKLVYDRTSPEQGFVITKTEKKSQ